MDLAEMQKTLLMLPTINLRIEDITYIFKVLGEGYRGESFKEIVLKDSGLTSADNIETEMGEIKIKTRPGVLPNSQDFDLKYNLNGFELSVVYNRRPYRIRVGPTRMLDKSGTIQLSTPEDTISTRSGLFRSLNLLFPSYIVQLVRYRE